MNRVSQRWESIISSRVTLLFENLREIEHFAQMCSIKTLFLEISQNSHENMCWNLFLIQLQPLGLLTVLFNSTADAVLYG